MEVLTELLTENVGYLTALQNAQQQPLAVSSINSGERLIIPAGDTPGMKKLKYALLIGGFILFAVVLRQIHKSRMEDEKNTR